ncbi:helix-turn-helix domain of resolvase [Neobacillus massiliamazoniensis]|uniref:Helix-turn-helix domain of resolvase n=1 Tax=Neobacillus massiliamazoniensis TaxID=1499688 RepID=A0A0U1NVP6_9BACI|nr:helix-turn-helix domain of resolvase [Neobacillus massiliamazoniensis]
MHGAEIKLKEIAQHMHYVISTIWLCALFSLNTKNKGLTEVKYVNANNILPATLITEIQKYVQGETIYIPKPVTAYRKWGTCSGGRKLIDKRNSAIKSAFISGCSIQQLAEEYFLSIETIKKIVYSNK